jgi:lambda family phage tail tape measure protein
MANNSVGSVSIDLEARIAKFESDLGRAARIADQRATEMRATLGSIAAVLGAGLSLAGISEFVKSSIDAQDAISKLSQKVGVSTETLSGWELASKQAGVENDAFQKGLIKLGQAAAASADGSKEQANAFKSIGVSATDASGHLKPIELLFGQVADKIAGYKDSTEKTVVATRLFGKAGADLIPLLNGGSKGLADYMKLADDFGLTVGGKSAKAAEEFNDSLEQLGFVSKGVANQLVTALAPALADLAQEAVGFFRGEDWKTVLAAISSGAKDVADHIGEIIDAAKLLGEILVTVYSLNAIRLGSEWVANLALQTTAVKGLIVAQSEWGAATAGSFAEAKKNIGLLGIAFNVVGAGLAGWEIGTYVRDQFEIVARLGDGLVVGAAQWWENIEYAANVAWASIVGVVKIAIGKIQTAIADQLASAAASAAKLPDFLGGDKIAAAYTKAADAIRPAKDATKQYNDELAKLDATHKKANIDIEKMGDDMFAATTRQFAPKPTDHSLDSIKAPTAAPKQLSLISAAADEMAKKYADAVQAIQSKIAADQESLNVGAKVTQAEKDRAKLIQEMDSGTLKVTASQRAYLLSLSDTDIALQKSIQSEKERQQGIADTLALTDKLSTALQDQIDQNAIADAGVGHGQEVQQRLQGELQIRQKFANDVAALNKKATQPENVGTTNGIGGDFYNMHLAEIAGFQAQAQAEYQKGLDNVKASQLDGMNGVRAAMEDFQTTQQNMAAQTKEFTTNALSGFSDAFASFVSGTETAKKAFGSLIDSMYVQALKFLADKSIQALFDSFGLTGNATPGSTAGGLGSFWGNLTNAFGFGGGSASSSGSDALTSSGLLGGDSIGAAPIFNLAGGLATGGSAAAGANYRVNEVGPELLTVGGQDYLMMGSQPGKVTPNSQMQKMTQGGTTMITNVNVQPTSTRRTATQTADAIARKQRVASSRNG